MSGLHEIGSKQGLRGLHPDVREVLCEAGGVGEAEQVAPGGDAYSDRQNPWSAIKAAGSGLHQGNLFEQQPTTRAEEPDLNNPLTAPNIAFFVVPGVPVAKGRARSFVRNGHVAHYTPEKTANYENLVKLAAQRAMRGRQPFAGACELELVLFMPVPTSWSNKKRNAALAGDIRPMSKPDCSNVLKAIEDAMNGVVWIDDKQETDVHIKKRYSTTPEAIVRVVEVRAHG